MTKPQRNFSIACASLGAYADVDCLFQIHLLNAHPLKLYNEFCEKVAQNLLDEENMRAVSYDHSSISSVSSTGHNPSSTELRRRCRECGKSTVTKCKYDILSQCIRVLTNHLDFGISAGTAPVVHSTTRRVKWLIV